MTEPREPLSRWVTPDVPQHRLDRMWVDISAAEQHRRASRWLVVSAVASTVLALGVVGVLVTRATFDSKSEPPRVTQFTDGSTAELGPKSSLTLALQDERHVQVRLNAGTATFEVTKRPSRQFLVEAGDVRVRVVGTRFTVQNETETDEVSVAVLRGIVEVTRHEQTVRLVAGQVWHSTGVGNTPALAPAEPGDMPPGDMRTGDDAQEAVRAPSVTVPSTTPSLPDEPLSTSPPRRRRRPERAPATARLKRHPRPTCSHSRWPPDAKGVRPKPSSVSSASFATRATTRGCRSPHSSSPASDWTRCTTPRERSTPCGCRCVAAKGSRFAKKR